MLQEIIDGVDVGAPQITTLYLDMDTVGLTCQMGNGDSSPMFMILGLTHLYLHSLLTVLAPLCCPNKVKSLLSQVLQLVGVRDGLAGQHKKANPVSTGVGEPVLKM